MANVKWMRAVISLFLAGLFVLGPVASVAAEIPVLRFVGPFDGDNVSGFVNVRVFSPNGEVEEKVPKPAKEVRLVVDDLPGIKMTSLGNMLYGAEWNSMTVANGSHRLTAIEIIWTTPPSVDTVTIEVTVSNSAVPINELAAGEPAGAVVSAYDAFAAIETALLPAGSSDPEPVPTPLPPPMPPFPPEPGGVEPPQFP